MCVCVRPRLENKSKDAQYKQRMHEIYCLLVILLSKKRGE